MPHNAPIRTALIGYGLAGKSFHTPLLRSVPGMALTRIVSSRAAEIHALLPDVLVQQDAHAAITAPDIDLVVIATPNDSHAPLAAEALRAGKHVVIDKPFAVTLAEARGLVQLARDTGRMLSVFHNRRYDSDFLSARAALQSGLLGQVSHHEAHIDRFRPNIRRRWREDPGPGAGLWFDLGPHLIDQSLQLFGLPESVTGNIATLRPGGQTDDWAHIQLNYPTLRVVLHATLLSAGGSPRSTLHGTSGSWIKYGADVQESQMVKGMFPGDPGFGVDPDPGIFIDGATGKRTESPAPIGDESFYYAGIRDAILNNAAPPVTAAQALAVQAVLETSFDSSEQGRTLPHSLSEEECHAFNFIGI